MLPRRRAPLWFEVVVAVAIALLLRAVEAALPRAGDGGGGDTAPLVAFWAIIATIASAIWKGLEVAGRVTLEVLKWSVLQLWSFARLIYNSAIAVGKEVIHVARKAWDFLQATYEHVLKPAWEHLWTWYDRARKWLEDVFGPIFRFLQSVRTWVLDFYAKYVRPILDALGIAQKVLRVLEGFGFEWAKRLDSQLAELQRRIDQPFQFVLGKINEIVNIVNRIVTLDGLIQRVALIRSIERDIREVSRAFVNWRSETVTEPEWTALRQQSTTRTIEDVTRDLATAYTTGGGRYQPWTVEMAAIWKQAIENPGRSRAR